MDKKTTIEMLSLVLKKAQKKYSEKVSKKDNTEADALFEKLNNL